MKQCTFTVLSMLDRIIKKVQKWGAKSKQQRSKRKLDFLNRHKEKFDWDVEDNGYTDMVEAEPGDTVAIPAELPGI